MKKLALLLTLLVGLSAPLSSQIITVNGVNYITTLRFTPQSQPGQLVEGLLYYDSTAKELKFYNGTTFRTISPISITGTTGVFTLANGSTGLTPILQFGGTTNAFPAIERSGTTIVFIRADSSTLTGVMAASYTIPTSNGGVGAFLINNTATNGLAQITDSTNTNGIEFNTSAASVNTCGTGTITANSRSQAGGFTATGATSCTVAFGTSFTNTPFCTVTELTTAGSFRISAISNAAFTVTGFTAGDAFTYTCTGVK